MKRINASAEFLNEENITQWSNIPLWLNTDDYTYSNKHICDHLNFTPTAFLKSLKKTINYFDSLNYPKPIYGVSDSKQKELIEKLHNLLF